MAADAARGPRLAPGALALMLTLAAGPASATKDDDEDEAKPPTPMQLLDRLKGLWVGEAQGVGPGGEFFRWRETERVGNLLDGDLLLIEGRGQRSDGSSGQHTLVVISHDSGSSRYEIRGYANGRAGTYPLLLTANGVQWDIPVSKGAYTRHRIEIDDTYWIEVREFIAPDKAPRKTLEMRLKRRGDTDWPESSAAK